MPGVESFNWKHFSIEEDSNYINGFYVNYYSGYNVVYEGDEEIPKGYYVIYEIPMSVGTTIYMFALGENAEILISANELFGAMINSMIKDEADTTSVKVDSSGLTVVKSASNGIEYYLGTATIEVPKYMDEMYFVFNWINPTMLPIGAYFCVPTGNEYSPSEKYSFSGHYVFVIPEVEPGTYTFKVKWDGILENIQFHYLDKEMYYYQYLNQDLEGNPIRHM